jgi:hypothetical protein
VLVLAKLIVLLLRLLLLMSQARGLLHLVMGSQDPVSRMIALHGI